MTWNFLCIFFLQWLQWLVCPGICVAYFQESWCPKLPPPLLGLWWQLLPGALWQWPFNIVKWHWHTCWWFEICFYFHPYLGKWSNLTTIFKWVETTNQHNLALYSDVWQLCLFVMIGSNSMFFLHWETPTLNCRLAEMSLLNKQNGAFLMSSLLDILVFLYVVHTPHVSTCTIYYGKKKHRGKNTVFSRWWFQTCFIFTPTLGRWSNLTSIFFKWIETTN